MYFEISSEKTYESNESNEGVLSVHKTHATDTFTPELIHVYVFSVLGPRENGCQQEQHHHQHKYSWKTTVQKHGKTVLVRLKADIWTIGQLEMSSMHTVNRLFGKWATALQVLKRLTT